MLEEHHRGQWEQHEQVLCGSPTCTEMHVSLGREPGEALTKKWVDGNS